MGVFHWLFKGAKKALKIDKKVKNVDKKSKDISAATEEKEEMADTANKARLIATEGQQKGSELKEEEGRSVRRVFGA